MTEEQHTIVIHCENCETNYVLPENAIPDQGKRVKCIKCGHIWYQRPVGQIDPELLAAQTQAEPEQAPQVKAEMPAQQPVISKKPSFTPPPRIPVPLWLKLTPLALAMGLCVLLAVSFRPVITHTFPPLQKVYNKLGMRDSTGIVLTDFTIEKTEEEEKVGLVLKGKLENTLDRAVPLPSMRIALLDKDRKVILSQVLKSSGKPLPAKKSYPINNKIQRISGEAAYIAIDIGNKVELTWR